jgi:flagellar motor switch/type III secretory pathway protein FliN
MTQTLFINNRQQLHEDSVLLPCVEQLVAWIAQDTDIRSIGRVAPELAAQRGWIVWKDAQQRGVAVNLQGIAPYHTALRMRLSAVQVALTFSKGLTAASGIPDQVERTLRDVSNRDPLMLTDKDECPQDWRLYQVVGQQGLILCGISKAAPKAVSTCTRKSHFNPTVTLGVESHICWDQQLAVGKKIAMKSLRAECSQQKLALTIFISQEGAMSIKGDGIESTQPLAQEGPEPSPAALMQTLVRLDIGAIELSLEELAALRVGTVIELQARMPLNCYMRVGATTLALAELNINQGDLSICIKEIVA